MAKQTTFSVDADAIERKRRAIQERKERMERMLESSDDEEAQKRDEAERMMAVARQSNPFGVSGVRMVKQAGSEMLTYFHEILSDIREIRNPKDRADMMMRLTKLYTIDLPSRLNVTHIEPAENKTDAIDAVVTPIEQ